MFQCSDFVGPAQIQQVCLYYKQQQWKNYNKNLATSEMATSEIAHFPATW